MSERPDVAKLLHSLRECVAETCDLAHLPHDQIVPQVNACLTELAQENSELTRKPHMRIPEILERMRDRAAHMAPRVRVRDVGTVQHIGNGVATISGLPHACTDELVTFPTGLQGMVLNLERGHVDVILLGPDEGIQGGDMVTSAGERLRAPVGNQLLGRIVNPLGQPLDDRGPIEATEYRYLEQDAPGIVQRGPVQTPLHTGLKVVDALTPIGMGQRELIVGDRQTGKTSLAVDAILNQAANSVECVYVAIGQKKSTTLGVIRTLRQKGALNYTTVVVSSSDDPPALRYLAPYAGCTMAEFLMRQGRDVLIVYDDLTRHADAYRELSLLLRRPPGREAYPGDIFYLHSRLLERACKLSEAEGGSSLTALPIVETQRGNLSAYVPTNIISITDGQIVLSTDLFNRNIRPAIDAGKSVSRVGGAAQTQAMRAVSGNLRLMLAQFEEVARFTRLGAEVDEITRRQIVRGERLQAALKQPVHHPLTSGQQILILLAVTRGYLDAIPVEKVALFEHDLLRHVQASQPGTFLKIDRTGELDEAASNVLCEMIETYRNAWLNLNRTSDERKAL
ncbi:MAG: F0F1 ATP synthase subunit alpha [Anaerolineae bacterium]|nr:F0F1 ATP synthase subunit alpha [Anaerolineae bacterium]